jgi:hypothetical protein
MSEEDIRDEYETRIAFTKSIIKQGDPKDIIPDETERLKIKVKALFDPVVLKITGKDSNDLIGFKCSKDDFNVVQLRLGYYTTQINKVLHEAIGQMRLNEIAHVSFEMEKNHLFESKANLKKCLKSNANNPSIFLDIKFEIHLIEIEK